MRFAVSKVLDLENRTGSKGNASPPADYLARELVGDQLSAFTQHVCEASVCERRNYT